MLACGGKGSWQTRQHTAVPYLILGNIRRYSLMRILASSSFLNGPIPLVCAESGGDASGLHTLYAYALAMLLLAMLLRWLCCYAGYAVTQSTALRWKESALEGVGHTCSCLRVVGCGWRLSLRSVSLRSGGLHMCPSCPERAVLALAHVCVELGVW